MRESATPNSRAWSVTKWTFKWTYAVYLLAWACAVFGMIIIFTRREWKMCGVWLTWTSAQLDSLVLLNVQRSCFEDSGNVMNDHLLLCLHVNRGCFSVRYCVTPWAYSLQLCLIYIISIFFLLLLLCTEWAPWIGCLIAAVGIHSLYHWRCADKQQRCGRGTKKQELHTQSLQSLACTFLSLWWPLLIKTYCWGNTCLDRSLVKEIDVIKYMSFWWWPIPCIIINFFIESPFAVEYLKVFQHEKKVYCLG